MFLVFPSVRFLRSCIGFFADEEHWEHENRTQNSRLPPPTTWSTRRTTRNKLYQSFRAVFQAAPEKSRLQQTSSAA
jgi:hypothetical protein